MGVGAAATIGAIVGDTIGYSIGRRYGMGLFERLGKRFPKHFGPGHVALAKQLFTRWGMWAVFFGRFIALLRIFAGPLAGALKMPYSHFLAANATGGLFWAGGTTAVVYYLGLAAEKWLSRFSWIALVVAIVIGGSPRWSSRTHRPRDREAGRRARLGHAPTPLNAALRASRANVDGAAVVLTTSRPWPIASKSSAPSPHPQPTSSPCCATRRATSRSTPPECSRTPTVNRSAAVGDRFVVHMDREALNDFPLGRYDVTVQISDFEKDR